MTAGNIDVNSRSDARPNILFIMFDQLRFDYLSCAGHPHLQTPNIDRLASRGLRFTRCYIQSPICGASRMSFYTGRYVSSHGASWNNVPLKVGELTLGDHLRALGMSSWLVGKTHMRADVEGMRRLGLSEDSVIGARIAECGFDVHVREDGLPAEGPDGFYEERPSAYNAYLQSRQYPGPNPWHDYANSAVDDDLNVASGWLLQNADKPANIREEDSETPWITSECIEFLQRHKSDKTPWLCHLSYIKPHWPYVVPKPYHGLYSADQVIPVRRHELERDSPNPVYDAFMNNAIGQVFSRDEVREKVIPAYMGLIKQCDDQLGRLFDYLDKSGQADNTVIVITSDHGDYLGDHWLGEKDLFHDCSAMVPLIVYDPSTNADSTRGKICDELVEGIDLASTFIELAGGEVPDHIVEGRSLVPFLHGNRPQQWREFAVSEYDYSMSPIASKLNVSAKDARLFMITDKNWKLVHAEGGFPPMLFDLQSDPDEYFDRGSDPDCQPIIEHLYSQLAQWSRRCSQRTTLSDDVITSKRGGSRRKGILLGLYDGSEVDEELLGKYRRKAITRFDR